MCDLTGIREAHFFGLSVVRSKQAPPSDPGTPTRSQGRGGGRSGQTIPGLCLVPRCAMLQAHGGTPPHCIRAHTCSHRHSHTHTCTHSHTHTQVSTCTHDHAHAHHLTFTCFYIHTHAPLTHTHIILTCTFSHAHTHSHVFTHSHTGAHRHTHGGTHVHAHTHTLPARSAQAPPLFIDNEHVFMDLEQKLSKYFSKDWKRETRGVSQSLGCWPSSSPSPGSWHGVGLEGAGECPDCFGCLLSPLPT